MKNAKYPLFISLIFFILLVLNNEWAKSRTYRFYHEVKNPAQPIREELKKDEFLSDEAEAETFIINLWATWCDPCQKEIPQLNQILQKYENENTLFLSITDEKEKDVLEWFELQRNEPEYFQLYDNKRLMAYLFSLNPDTSLKKGRSPELLPTNIIIHQNEVVFFEQGFSEEHISRMDSVLLMLSSL